MFFPVRDIITEFELAISKALLFDAVTIVGEGEPTLYLGLGELIAEINSRTDKPVAVITNGALLCDPQVRSELSRADIVLPSLDAYDQQSYQRINRPHPHLHFDEVYQGLKTFAHEYEGQLWLEIMLMQGINADDASLAKYAALLQEMDYDRLYLNTPVRPPAEEYVQTVDHATMQHAAELLGGLSIDLLVSSGFHSEISDDYDAILEILKNDARVESLHYKGYDTYRLRPKPGKHRPS